MITVNFIFWGGERLGDPAYVSSPELSPVLPEFYRWAKILSNVKGEYLASGGKAFFDFFTGTNFRLFVKPFYIEKSGKRSVYYYLGIAVTKELCQKAENYTTLVQTIDRIPLDKLIRLSENKERLELNFIPDRASSGIPRDEDSLKNCVIRGTYQQAILDLSTKISFKNFSWFDKIFIACNPPEIYPEFTTLLVTDDFYVQNFVFPKPKSVEKAIFEKTVESQKMKEKDFEKSEEEVFDLLRSSSQAPSSNGISLFAKASIVLFILLSVASFSSYVKSSNAKGEIYELKQEIEKLRQEKKSQDDQMRQLSFEIKNLSERLTALEGKLKQFYEKSADSKDKYSSSNKGLSIQQKKSHNTAEEKKEINEPLEKPETPIEDIKKKNKSKE